MQRIDESEVRTAALARAAARFGRNVLRNPAAVGLVNGKLLRRLQSSILSAASLGHRSSVVLWGPSEGGKRATLEVLCQIFCVSVDRATHTVVRHPGNMSSEIGANRGVPVLGVVLDGAALRSDNDAAQAVLAALYNFWHLAAEVRNSSDGGGQTTTTTTTTWAMQADDILSWLFEDVVPESMHKQPPPGSFAASVNHDNNNAKSGGSFANSSAGGNSNNNRGKGKTRTNNYDDTHSSSAAAAATLSVFSGGGAGGVNNADNFCDAEEALERHLASAKSLSGGAGGGGAAAASGSGFRAAAQNTFRIFTHGGNTLLTALQHTLLELSKAGVSPCFFIHDVRALGQSCDKLLYMISGLLHEQELQAAEVENNSGASGTNTSSAKNNSSSGGSAGGVGGAKKQKKKGSTSTNCGKDASSKKGGARTSGGMSIVMTSTSPDLRLEKRLSSRMNCDFLHCPVVSMPFVNMLDMCFRETAEEIQLLDQQVRIQRWQYHEWQQRIKKEKERCNGGGNGGGSSSMAQQQAPMRRARTRGQIKREQERKQRQQMQRGQGLEVDDDDNDDEDYEDDDDASLVATNAASNDNNNKKKSSVAATVADIGSDTINDAAALGALPAFMVQVRAAEHRFLAALQDRESAIHIEYATLTRRCEQLGRPAHVVRRLIETWFELANDCVADFTKAPVPMAVLERHALADVSPLRPLDAVCTDKSRSAPREVVGLLACAVGCASRHVGRESSASSTPFRTVQEHFTLFQELRVSSTNDSIDAWTKAATLLQRWGIVTCSSSQISAGGTAAKGGAGGASSSSANAAMSVSSSSRVELDVENLDLLRAKVREFCSIVYDQSTLQAVRSLMG